MTPTQTKASLAKAGLGSTAEASFVFEADKATVRRWKQFGTDGCNAILLRLLASGKITIQDIEAVHD